MVRHAYNIELSFRQRYINAKKNILDGVAADDMKMHQAGVEELQDMLMWEPTLPPLYRLKMHMVLVDEIDIWHEAENHRLEAESTYEHICRTYDSEITPQEREDLKAFRTVLDDLRVEQAENKPVRVKKLSKTQPTSEVQDAATSTVTDSSGAEPHVQSPDMKLDQETSGTQINSSHMESVVSPHDSNDDMQLDEPHVQQTSHSSLREALTSTDTGAPAGTKATPMTMPIRSSPFSTPQTPARFKDVAIDRPPRQPSFATVTPSTR